MKPFYSFAFRLLALLAVGCTMLPATEEARASIFTIHPYKANYVLPFTYDFQSHEDARKSEEALYQISILIPLGYDEVNGVANVGLAYTQQAFWQIYDEKDTRPFRQTAYNPELFLRFPDLEQRWQMAWLSAGYEHESNGESLDGNSRSWNRLFLEAKRDLGDLDLGLRVWHWLEKPPKETPDDPNGEETPEIYRYYGYGELSLGYDHGRYRAALMVRNNLNPQNNKGAFRMDVMIPMEHYDIYLQYWDGYGESSGDYNEKTRRLGLGFMFTR